jgi:hypothetical protein
MYWVWFTAWGLMAFAWAAGLVTNRRLRAQIRAILATCPPRPVIWVEDMGGWISGPSLDIDAIQDYLEY